MGNGIVDDVRAPDVPSPPPDGGPGEPDAALAAHLAADLDGGFAVLMERHRAVVWSVARRFTTDPADAEDLAADAFLRAYRALRGYDARRLAALRVRPWLLTILRNTARNAARDRSRRPDPPPSYETAEGPATGPGVEQQVESSHLQRELGTALARLPEVQRTAVVLRHVVGLGTGEVAEVLGVAEGTAKSHVSRGLARLRPLVEDLREEGTR